MEKFEVGKTYWTRSICDAEMIIRITIVKRTASFVTTSEGTRLKVSNWNGAETVKPWGSYSMAPTISAERCVIR